MIICSRCGNKSPDDAVFCDQCGARLSEQQAPAAQPAAVAPIPAAPAVTPPVAPQAAPQPRPMPQPMQSQADLCPSCGASVTPGEMFCSECGSRLAAPTPEPVAAPEPVVAPEPVTVATASKGQCPFCGAAANPKDEFCYACGAQLAGGATIAQPAAPATKPIPAPAPIQAVEPVDAAAQPSPICAACGAQVPEGQAFCPFCGAAVIGAPQEAFAEPLTAAPTVSSARLVVVANNTELPLAAGSETVVGREDPYSGIYPDIDLTPHGGEDGGVSRRHFKINGIGNQYTIEDLNSTNLTIVNQTRLQPGVRVPLQDGDEIQAGRVKFIFRIN